jgi:lipoprotein-anchoring transpeptidase ErfK/SrfK
MRRLICVPLLLLALPASAQAAGETLTLALDHPVAVWHTPVTAAGAVSPATPGLGVVVSVAGSDVGRATTDAAGHFAVPFSAVHAGPVVARLAASPSASAPVVLVVTPVVKIRIRSAVAFRGASIDIRVQPASWKGRVLARTEIAAVAAGTRRVRIRNGTARVVVPAPALGRMRVVVEVPAIAPYTAATAKRSFKATGRRLAAGDSGTDVRVLLRGLAKLGFRTPGVSSTLSRQATDSIVAFQKAYKLPRTYVFDADDWRKFLSARRIRPRHRDPKLHIEIDKTRQILLVVKNGRVIHILPTSTGATGNTPEGRWKIRWKAPSTRTWLGSAILYRTMTFKGNEFAIHGFAPVPSYPASHGCARIPMWAADWLYRQSPVGETVYVYR